MKITKRQLIKLINESILNEEKTLSLDSILDAAGKSVHLATHASDDDMQYKNTADAVFFIYDYLRKKHDEEKRNS